jgi:O-acetyl-ADP-ribose deacetylase (regulator of RNase III)
MFRTGLRAPHMVLAGAMVPAGTVFVTPALNSKWSHIIEAVDQHRYSHAAFNSLISDG